MTDRPTPKTCEKNGHVRGPGDKCLFCKTALPRTVLPVDPDDFFARWEALHADARALRAEVRAARQFRRRVRDELRAWLDEVTCAQLYLALGITHEETTDG